MSDKGFRVKVETRYTTGWHHHREMVELMEEVDRRALVKFKLAGRWIEIKRWAKR